MSPENIATAVTFVVVGFSMLVTHNVADHWVQTDCQARDKGLVGENATKGRLACLRHVTSYTVCTALVTGTMWALFSLQITWASFLAGQMISAITHYWADRRHTLARLAELVRLGKFYRRGAPRPGKDDNPSLGTGAYALDQAWHWWWIFIASVVTAIAA